MGLSEKQVLQLMVCGTGARSVIVRIAEILLYLDEEAFEMCPSRSDLGLMAGVTERSARRAIKHLEDLGALRQEVRPSNRRRIYPDKIRLLAIVDRLP